VGLLFLGVSWQYHTTLNRSISDSLRLQDVFEARKNHAFRIGHYMLEARRNEKNFLLERDCRYMSMVNQDVERALERVSRLSKIDAANRMTWQRMVLLIRTHPSGGE
jgi:hypothetical protein